MANKVIVEGRLTDDAEIKTSNSSGKEFLVFTIAHNDYFDKDDNGDPRVDYWDVLYFGKNQSNLQQQLQKGKKVEIMGTPKINKYTNNNGKEVKQPSINADYYGGITFLRDNSNNNSRNQQNSRNNTQNTTNYNSQNNNSQNNQNNNTSTQSEKSEQYDVPF